MRAGMTSQDYKLPEIGDDPLGPGIFRIPHGHIPVDMQPQKPRIRQKFKSLVGRDRRQDDVDLIRFIREEIIDIRRPFLPKMSNALYRTPQAAQVDAIINKKVCNPTK
jgi:hypothetical protein